MRDFYKGSIYENVSSSKNWITFDWDKYKEKYKAGYSSSSTWIDINYDDEDENSKKRSKENLNYALIQVCRSVNLIRHKFGIGENKALSVKWAIDTNQTNTLDDNVVYLSPSPLLSRSNLTIQQRYDVIIGQALLSSVQKHIIPSRLYKFLKRCAAFDSNNKIEITIDNESISFSNGSFKLNYCESYYSYKLDQSNKNVVKKTLHQSLENIPYKNRLGFYNYNNLTFGMFNEWYNIWRAIEQDITEKAITNEYKGSASYLFVHRDYYLDKKFSSILEETVQYFDLEWLPKVWHLLIIHNILEPKKITKVHPVYERIIKMADETLILNPFEDSETRFCSVVELMGKVSNLIEELQFEEFSVTLSSSNSNNNPLPEKIKNKISKISDDISKTGLSDALGKFGNIIEKKSHRSLVSNECFDVGDENALKFFELNLLSKGLNDTDKVDCYRYKYRYYSDDMYNIMANKNKSYIDFLKQSLLIRSFDFVSEEFSMKNGFLDENNLWKIMFNNQESENIFYQKTMPRTSDNVHITLVFDNSGSMGYFSNEAQDSRISICNQIAVILKEVVSALPNVRLDIFSYYETKFVSYENDPKSVAYQISEGGTPEGPAIAKATYMMEKFRNENPDVYYGKRYLIFVGDGVVNIESVTKSLDFVKNNTNIKFFHIGIDGAYDNDYGETVYGKGNFVVVPSQNLKHNLCMSIVKILS